MRQFIVVDLDGTLCDAGHRVDYAKAGQWDDFHSRSGKDKPFADVLSLVVKFNETHSVLVATGCNERYRTLRTDWLNLWRVPVDVLLMRPDDDYTQDGAMKLRLLEGHFGSKENVLSSVAFALDDRDRVVEAFRNYGLNCWQVRNGEY